MNQETGLYHESFCREKSTGTIAGGVIMATIDTGKTVEKSEVI